jgi:NADH dehydrogenase
MANAQKPRVVVVGAGFGGLACVRALRTSPVEVTLIDRRNYHLFQPLLYQVATAALSPADIAWPIRAVLSRQANAHVEMGRVVGVDAARRRVLLQSGRALGYDFLVLATGARHSYFGNDDWEPVAPGLKKIADATAIRERILIAFEQAETTDDADERGALLTFVIVGAGPTGVEMAGALAELARHALAADFRTIDPRLSRIILVEAGTRVLPTFPEALGHCAADALERLGVEVMLGRPVSACDPDGVSVGGERIAARTVIWAAGVVASPAGKWIGAEQDRAGRIIVEPDLSLPGEPAIFAIGDTASVAQETGRPVPGIAPAAKQMGAYVGRLIDARLAGRQPGAPFRYRHQGDLATIGRRSAVANFNGVHLTGTLAWLLWAIAHIYFLIGWRSRALVAVNWLWNYLTFGRGARLITSAALEDREEPARRDAAA